MNTLKRDNLYSHMKAGLVYRREDLLNNAKYLTEDVSQLQLKVAKNLDQFDKIQLMKLSVKYGKVATRKYLQSLLGN